MANDTIAFLGMGLLGSNFVQALRKKDKSVNVWNRTFERAKAVEQYGAKAFEDVKDAVRDVERIHVTVKDDASVDEVLAAAAPALKSGAVIFDHTTTSAKGAIERTAKWKEKGVTYLHSPVFMGPQNALESTGVMLVSGDQTVVSKYQNDLSPLTGKLLNLGDKEGKAAAMKLTGNLFLIGLTATLSDALSIAKAQGLESNDVLSLFTEWNPGAGANGRLKRILSAEFDKPSWELQMARKDAGLMMKAAEESGTNLTVLPSVANVMDEWIGKGHGSNDWSIIAKDSL